MSDMRFPNWSVSFDIAATEDAKEFFGKIMNDARELQDAVEERIRQLFSEHIGISGKDEETFEDACKQILEVFSIGYKCGWNDFRNIITSKQQKS